MTDFIFFGSKVNVDGDPCQEIKTCLLIGKKSMTNLDHVLKSRDFADKFWIVYFCFSSSRVWMWELEHKECWVLKNWCFWVVVLEKTLEISLDSKEIKPVNPKGSQPWIFIARAAGDVGLIPVLERSLGGGHGNPLQNSCLENPMDRGAWRATVLRVAKS